jgi:hypothetical protein
MAQTAPVWAVFGDLMAGLLGAFVLILVGGARRAAGAGQPEAEISKRQPRSSAAWRWRRRWRSRWPPAG